jgi:fumarate hydratase class II
VLGYDRAAEIAKKALEENKTVREVARASGWITEEELVSRLGPPPR